MKGKKSTSSVSCLTHNKIKVQELIQGTSIASTDSSNARQLTYFPLIRDIVQSITTRKKVLITALKIKSNRNQN